MPPRKGGGGRLWQALKLGRPANRLQGQEAGVLGFLRPYKVGENLFFGLGLGNAGGLTGLNAF